MLRLELGAVDLANLRLSQPWGPLAESLFSLVSLQRRRPTVLTEGWRKRILGELSGDPRAAPLLALMRPSGFVDFHTLIGQAATLEEGLDALQAVTTDRLRSELLWAVPPRIQGELPWVREWLRRLATGDAKVRQDLLRCMRDYHELAIGPYWEPLHRHLEADWFLRARVMAEGGVGQLLATLHPAIRWRPPFLDITRPADCGGRGRANHVLRSRGLSLTLVPSACLDHPTVYKGDIDRATPDVLFYPTLREPAEAVAILAPPPTNRAHGLRALLGDTRAAALDATAEPCTTTELARRIGVSPATASHHARALREAGLVMTRRIGQAVLHTSTSIGALLLNGDQHWPPTPPPRLSATRSGPARVGESSRPRRS